MNKRRRPRMKNIVFAHKDFTFNQGDYVNSQYEAITTHDLKCDLKSTKFDTDLPDEIFGEITFVKYLLDNWEDPKEWKCTHHYRRILQSMENVPCHPEFMFFQGRLYDQTCWYHSKTIIDKFIAYLEKRTDGMPNAFKQTLTEGFFVPYNIFSGPKNVFEAWYEIVGKPVVDFIQNDLNIKTIEDAHNFVKADSDALVPRQGKNTDIVYQSRIGGFLGERMSTMFWRLYFNGAMPCRVKLLENGQSI